jgi:choline kinase
MLKIAFRLGRFAPPSAPGPREGHRHRRRPRQAARHSHTDEVPKTLVPVGARTMLGWQMRAFAGAGVDELVIIRGYRGDVLEAGARAAAPPGVKLRFVDNPAWERNNILLSLACARAELDGPTLLTYSDIIFTPSGGARAHGGPRADRPGDRRRLPRHLRGPHRAPARRGRGRRISTRRAGCAGSASARCRRPRPTASSSAWPGSTPPAHSWSAPRSTSWPRATAAASTSRTSAPRATRTRTSPICWQELIDGGTPIHPVTIHGQWREIDTGQDLERAIALVESTSEEWS